MLRPGMIVERADGMLIRLRGRNACNRRIWWGNPVRDGKVLRRRCKLVDETQCAVLTEDGPRYPLIHM